MNRKMRILGLLSLVLILILAAGACAPAPAEEPAEEPEQEVVVEESEPAEEAEAEEPAEEAEAEEAEEIEPVEITYWHTMSDPETEQLDKVIAVFEEAHPGIKVLPTRYAYSDFKSALLTGLAGGEGPDTARMDIVWVPEFADQGALMKLDGNLEGFDEIADQVFPGPLATNFWDGGYYGLPQDTNTQVLLWHQEAFEAAGVEVPTTMEEFAAAACELTEGEKQYGYALGGTYFWAPAPVFYAMGGKIVDEGITTAEGYVNGPESVAAFTMLTDLFQQGCISPNLLGGGVGTADGHATGLYSMIIDGPWMVDIYAGNFPDFEVNFALIPAGPDGTTSSVVGGQDVVIFETSEHPEAAKAWVKFLMSEESQKMMAEVGVMPTLAHLTGDASMPAHFEIFMQQLETAQARVPHPKWGEMDGAVNNAFQRMLREEQTVQEALDQAAEEIDALLAE